MSEKCIKCGTYREDSDLRKWDVWEYVHDKFALCPDCIDELKTEPYSLLNNSCMICPYCGHEDPESWEFGEDSNEAECGVCGREFDLSVNRSVTYSTAYKEIKP